MNYALFSVILFLNNSHFRSLEPTVYRRFYNHSWNLYWGTGVYIQCSPHYLTPSSWNFIRSCLLRLILGKWREVFHLNENFMQKTFSIRFVVRNFILKFYRILSHVPIAWINTNSHILHHMSYTPTHNTLRLKCILCNMKKYVLNSGFLCIFLFAVVV